jgi:uncharacterized RDD family membrane protein YckC
MASKGQRFVAYLIDLIPIVLLGLITGSSMRTVGHVGAINWVGAAYLLLRDVSGASVGKLIVGLRVVGHDGGQARLANRILRNVTLALGPALTGLSLSAGFVDVVAELSGSLVAFVDVVFLLMGGRRLGDRIAGTSVASRTAV